MVKEFYDTSVLVAAYWEEHPSHTQSFERLRYANPKTSACGLHTLAEVYSSMTGMPIRNRISPSEAVLVIEHLRQRVTVVSLTEDEYMQTIQKAADLQFTSGRIYDALLLACAAKCQAEIIYTWNIKHFRNTVPSLAEKVRTP